MNAFEFMTRSPILTFLLGCAVLRFAFLVWNRFMRHLNIRKAGWPPAHLDADGDFKPAPKAEDRP